MNILCVLTDSHKILFDNYFIKTIPCPENVIVKKLDLEGDGSYNSKSWQVALVKKIEFVLSYLNKVDNDTFYVFSDVDVQFFPNFSLDELKNELIKSKKDILFQKESSNKNSRTVNTGFYIAKSSSRLLKFFQQVLEALNNSEIKNDQKYINLLLKGSSISWGFLPFSYYAWSQGLPPPGMIYCHHANSAPSVKLKISKFEFIKNYYESNYIGKIYLIVKHSLRKLFTILKRSIFIFSKSGLKLKI